MSDFLIGLFEAIISTTTIDSKWLKFGAGSAGNTVVMAFINNLWHYLFLAAVGVTLVYFLIEINQRLAVEGMGNMNLKTFFAPFIKLMIAIAVLSQGAKIVGWLLSMNDTLVNYAGSDALLSIPTGGTPDVDTTFHDTMVAALEDFGLIESIAVVVIMIPCYVISLVLQLVWMYKAVTYKLEVLYRTAVTPFALADVYSGQHSNALRWLKGFIALALYAMAIIIIPKIGTLLTSALTIDAFTGTDISFWDLMGALFSTFVMPFACLGVMGTIKQLTKEVMG